MEISKASLLADAERLGFEPKALEKVWRLMDILEHINVHPFLQNRLVLKGGTALNLFAFDLPRLSVDIDLNYIGSIDREIMMQERPVIEKSLEDIFHRENLQVRRIPDKHAGGKWRIQYRSALPGHGSLEVDLNFMFRTPLWDAQRRFSVSVGSHKPVEILVLDIHELAAGKMTALFARHAARDLFDAHHLLTKIPFDFDRLRFAFVLYVGMSSMEWQTISAESLTFNGQEFHDQLNPVAPQKLLAEKNIQAWANRMIQESQHALQNLLPFKHHETEFLRILSDSGEIAASLLTKDLSMQEKIQKHPLLQWRAFLRKKFGPGKPQTI